MSKARRRKQLDPDWGKTGMIENTFKVYKDSFRPRTKEAEEVLRLSIFKFFRIVLENDAPGVTVLNCFQELGGIEGLPEFKTPLLMHGHFIGLDDLVNDAKTPRLPIEDIRHLAEETDFSSHRIAIFRLNITGESDFLTIIPVAEIQEELKGT